MGQQLSGSEAPLAGQFDLIVLDLDGVVYIGPDAVPGAADALDQAREIGMPLRFVTNNASRPPEVVAEHLTRLGVPATTEEVVTSAQVAAALLARRFAPGDGVLVVGAAGLRDALAERGLVPMDSVDQGPVAVVQGFGPDVGWRLLAEATRAVRAGLFWMATNLDPTVPTAFGAAPGNGALVQVVASAAGRGPDEVAGKPQPGAFLEAARQAGSSRPLVIGDRLDTDLEGARAAGMHGLLVLTGVTGAVDLLTAPPHRRPHYVGRDLQALLTGQPVVQQLAASVQVVDDAVRVSSAGDDALDLLRVAAVSVWTHLDRSGAAEPDPAHPDPAHHGPARLDLDELLGSLRSLEPGAAWAR